MCGGGERKGNSHQRIAFPLSSPPKGSCHSEEREARRGISLPCTAVIQDSGHRDEESPSHALQSYRVPGIGMRNLPPLISGFTSHSENPNNQDKVSYSISIFAPWRNTESSEFDKLILKCYIAIGSLMPTSSTTPSPSQNRDGKYPFFQDRQNLIGIYL